MARSLADAGARCRRDPARGLAFASRRDPRHNHGRVTMAMGMSRQDRIRERAYQLWEEAGRPSGRDLEHWARAEAELLAAAPRAPAPAPPVVAPLPVAPLPVA